MSIVCRKGVIEDLPVLLEIEKRSSPRLLYLDGVKDEFFDNTTGELIVAEEDGVPIGFARFSLQYDGSGWLEVLRVDPDHQKKGCGATIWKRFIELCGIYKVPFVRMYTGLTNYASRVLGERNGLKVAYQTREGTLMADSSIKGSYGNFRKVTSADEAEKAIMSHAGIYHGYFCQNRTFYGINRSVCEGLFKDVSIWTDNNGSCVITGARFLKDQGLHLGLMGGDLDACISLAKAVFSESGLPKLVCMIPSERDDYKAALEKAGFTFPDSQIIMLERAF